MGELGALYPPPTERVGQLSSFVTLGESGLLGGPKGRVEARTEHKTVDSDWASWAFLDATGPWG